MSRGKRMTAFTLGELVEWNNKGLGCKDCAKICGVSDKTAQKYLAIIKRISSGEDYCINPQGINENVIEEFCLKHGIRKTVNTYSVGYDQETPELEDYEYPTVKVEEVREKLYAGVDALLNWLMGV